MSEVLIHADQKVFAFHQTSLLNPLFYSSTGCNANILWQEPPKTSLDMVKDAFWDYVAKATSTAEESLNQIRQSELGQEVK